MVDHIRAVYTGKNKPRLSLAYISREGSHFTTTTYIRRELLVYYASPLSSRPDWSNDDVVCFGA